MCEEKIDIAVISEPCQIKDDWYADESGKATIWVMGPERGKIKEEEGKKGKEYVGIRVGDIHLTSVYLSPNIKNEEFGRKIDKMKDDLKRIEGKRIVAGDYNAKAGCWGERRTDTRGG